MAKLGILLTLGPFQFENWETAANIAEAALDKGHEVDFFLYLDGIYNPNQLQTFPDLDILPRDRFTTILEKGAHITACGICVNARGQDNGRDYIEGVSVGGLPDFAEMIGEVDRLISL